MQEKIIQTKTCKHCNSDFYITDKDLEFYKKVSPKFNGEVFEIPTPTLCPDCRQQRRLAFRNERNLYKRKCDATGEDIISIYSPDKKLTIYSQDFWWSDKWDAFNYGKNFDFKKGFFEQFVKLSLKVPRLFAFATNNENSLYTNGSAYNNNCYLIFVSDHNKNTNYAYGTFNSENSQDLLDSENCIQSYECIGSKRLHSCLYIQSSENCSNSQFLKGCKSCDTCFCCNNLLNKKYYFFNKKYKKEEYFKRVNAYYKDKSLLDIQKDFLEYSKLLPNKFNISYKIENSSGDYISESKSSHNIFNSHRLQNCNYIIVGNKAKDSQDAYVVIDNSELIYESISIIALNKGIGNYCVWHGNNIFYSDTCFQCSNCFGCIGLKNKSYCILNKQYTKEEYNILVPKIIEKMKADGEWGEFFPASLSPFGYNETVAQEYFPINSPLQRGARGGVFNRSTYTPPKPNVEKVIPASKLPENISDIPDDILNWAIECEVTKKPFRIIPQELEFYRKHNIPVPRRHPDQRHLDRMKLRNPRKLFTRDCDKCGVSMQTTYSPDREEIVYCQTCYDKEIY